MNLPHVPEFDVRRIQQASEVPDFERGESPEPFEDDKEGPVLGERRPSMGDAEKPRIRSALDDLNDLSNLVMPDEDPDAFETMERDGSPDVDEEVIKASPVLPDSREVAVPVSSTYFIISFHVQINVVKFACIRNFKSRCVMIFVTCFYKGILSF